MRFQTLDQWLHWQEGLHPTAIELGLERPGRVLRRLHPEPPPFTVITVGGTNGKGSSVAMAEAILRAAGYRVGAYTSPHLIRYNERVRIAGQPVTDEALCAAFDRVDRVRGDISLTYFEFGTLAAVDIFYGEGLDVAILEVGLGGRLDAVNLIDPDVSLITSVALDHQAWLGEDRESIGREKAGILRAGRPAVCGDPEPPQALMGEAARLGAELHCIGRDYGFRIDDGEGTWAWWAGARHRNALPRPALRGEIQYRNAAGVLMALEALSDRLPLSQQAVRDGLMQAGLPGRFQVVPGEPLLILDVAHNPEAAAELAANLRRMPATGRTLAVVGMLGDKDVETVAGVLAPAVDKWFPAGLEGDRALDGDSLAKRLRGGGVETGPVSETVPAALEKARGTALPGDRIVVFGSFFTVAQALMESV